MALRVFGELTGSLRQSLNRTTEFPSDQLERLGERGHEILAALSPSLISSVHATDISGLVDLAVTSSSNPDALRRVLVTIGYGVGVRPEVALRLPAYVLPVIQMYQGLERLGLPLPRTRLYSAHAMKIFMGGDESKTWLAGVRNLAITASFIQRFFPEYAQYFVYDFLLPPSVEVQTQLNKSAARLQCLRRDDPVLDEAGKSLEKMAGNNGGGEVSPWIYAAAHATANFDLEDGVVTSRMVPPSDTYAVVTVGGWPERIFNLVRAALRLDQQYSLRGAISLLTTIGGTPVYSCREGEPTFAGVDGILSEPDKFIAQHTQGSENYKKDLAALFAMVGLREYLQWAAEVEAAFQGVVNAFQANFLPGNPMNADWLRQEKLRWLECLCWFLLKTRGNLEEALSVTLNGGLEERRPKREVVEDFRVETRPL